VNRTSKAGAICTAIGAISLIGAGAWHAGASSAMPGHTRAQQSEPPVVATINLDELFQPSLTDFAERVRSFEEDLAKWDTRIANLTAEIQKLQDDLETMELTPEQRREKATELFEKEAMRQSLREIFQRRAQFDEGEIYRIVYIRAMEIIREVAEQEGFDLVVFDDRRTPPIMDRNSVPATSVKNAIGNRTVLHVNEALDVTQLVIARYNNEYQAGRWTEQDS